MAAITINKRAGFDYEILETYEAGIVLEGHEVKSIRSGRIDLQGSFAVVRNAELWLLNVHISPYQPLNTPSGYDPNRSRKLLLGKQEIKTLVGRLNQKGLTLVPLKVYTRRGLMKIELGLARHRKKHDKREVLKRRDAEREIRSR